MCIRIGLGVGFLLATNCASICSPLGQNAAYYLECLQQAHARVFCVFLILQGAVLLYPDRLPTACSMVQGHASKLRASFNTQQFAKTKLKHRTILEGLKCILLALKQQQPITVFNSSLDALSHPVHDAS